MAYHDQNRDIGCTGDNPGQPETINFQAMSLKELQVTIDAELLAATTAEILAMPASKRTAAIADFAEIDPELGAKLHLSVSLGLS